MEKDRILYGDQEASFAREEYLKSSEERIEKDKEKRMFEELSEVLKKINQNIEKSGSALELGTKAGIAFGSGQRVYDFNHSLGNSANIISSPMEGDIERRVKSPVDAWMFQMFGTNGLYGKGPNRSNPLTSYYYNTQAGEDLIRKGSMDVADLGIAAAGLALPTAIGLPLAVGAGALVSTARNDLLSDMRVSSDLMSTSGRHVYGEASNSLIGEGFSKRERDSIAGMVKDEGYSDDYWFDLSEVNDLFSTTTQAKMYKSVRNADEFKEKFSKLLEASKKVSTILSQSLDEAGSTLSQMRLVGAYNVADMKEFAIDMEYSRKNTGMSRAEAYSQFSEGANYSEAATGSKKFGVKSSIGAMNLLGAFGSKVEDYSGDFYNEEHQLAFTEEYESGGKQKAINFLTKKNTDFLGSLPALASMYEEKENGELVLDEEFVKKINSGTVENWEELMKNGNNFSTEGMYQLQTRKKHLMNNLSDKLDPNKMMGLTLDYIAGNAGVDRNDDINTLSSRFNAQAGGDDDLSMTLALLYKNKNKLEKTVENQEVRNEQQVLQAEYLKETSYKRYLAKWKRGVDKWREGIVAPVTDSFKEYLDDKRDEKLEKKGIYNRDTIESSSESMLIQDEKFMDKINYGRVKIKEKDTLTPTKYLELAGGNKKEEGTSGEVADLFMMNPFFEHLTDGIKFGDSVKNKEMKNFHKVFKMIGGMSEEEMKKYKNFDEQGINTLKYDIGRNFGVFKNSTEKEFMKNFIDKVKEEDSQNGIANLGKRDLLKIASDLTGSELESRGYEFGDFIPEGSKEVLSKMNFDTHDKEIAKKYLGENAGRNLEKTRNVSVESYISSMGDEEILETIKETVKGDKKLKKYFKNIDTENELDAFKDISRRYLQGEGITDEDIENAPSETERKKLEKLKSTGEGTRNLIKNMSQNSKIFNKALEDGGVSSEELLSLQKEFNIFGDGLTEEQLHAVADDSSKTLSKYKHLDVKQLEGIGKLVQEASDKKIEGTDISVMEASAYHSLKKLNIEGLSHAVMDEDFDRSRYIEETGGLDKMKEQSKYIAEETYKILTNKNYSVENATEKSSIYKNYVESVMERENLTTEEEYKGYMSGKIERGVASGNETNDYREEVKYEMIARNLGLVKITEILESIEKQGSSKPFNWSGFGKKKLEESQEGIKVPTDKKVAGFNIR